MRRKYGASEFLIIALSFVMAAAGQIDTPPVSPEKDLGDLFKRVSASRLVVVGTVAKSEGVSKRLSASDVNRMVKVQPDSKTAKTSLEGVVGGILHSISVEETLCRQEDFEVRPATTTRRQPESLQTVLLFVPHDEPLWQQGYQKESLLEGHRYMVFLVEPNEKKQIEWTDSFQLAPKHVYYRAEGGSRGVVRLVQPTRDNLTPKQPTVLEKVKRLCQAVRPADAAAKFAALKELMDSGDPILQKEAELAVRALRSHRNPERN